MTESNGFRYSESKWRHCQLSDEKICFFATKTAHVIHDKHCVLAKGIPDKEILCLEDYREDLQQCRKCAKRAYVQIGAKDPEAYAEYESFFEKVMASNKQLRSIYIVHKMKTRIVRNCMMIWYGEDVWQIIALDKDGNVQLKHNNYRKYRDGNRSFMPGFHIQSDKCRSCRLQYAISIISSYDYNHHFAQEELPNKEVVMEAQITELKIEESFINDKKREEESVNIKKTGKWVRLIEWLKKQWIKR